MSYVSLCGALGITRPAVRTITGPCPRAANVHSSDRRGTRVKRKEPSLCNASVEPAKPRETLPASRS